MLKVPFWLPVCAALAVAQVASQDGRLRVAPPAGWTVEAAAAPALFKLQGPLRYSALVSRLQPTLYLYNRAAVSNSLERLLTRVAAEAGVTLDLDLKLRHVSLANGAEVDYRQGRVPGRPAMLLGLCTISGQVLLVQVVSHHAEANLREIVGSLVTVGAAPGRPSAEPPGSRSPRWLAVLWAAAVLAVLAAMTYWWFQLQKPSRYRRGPRID